MHLTCWLLQFKSLATLGVEGYGVLLNVSTSDCHVMCGSDTAQGFIDAEEANGHDVDNTYFKYMCGMHNFDFVARRHHLHNYHCTFTTCRSKFFEEKETKQHIWRNVSLCAIRIETEIPWVVPLVPAVKQFEPLVSYLKLAKDFKLWRGLYVPSWIVWFCCNIIYPIHSTVY